jgi:multicomponent K+:H+ antiporter subunit D
MTHWIILPLVMPPTVAALMILAMRHHLDLARIFAVGSGLALLAIALGLLWQASDGTVTAYHLGNWPAPYGIVLVLDRLSALMVALTVFLALVVTLYAIGTDWDACGKHFHALVQFQVMGLCGAFLTGDVFNLFVFFEVLLIASYGLMIHGGGELRLQSGVQYVVYNLLGSTLFLFALGAIYAVTGTLNMADLAARVAAMPAEDSGLVRVAAVLLFLVFAVKAALLPLHFWLPATYAQAPAPIAALFAVMTKVGAYAIIRLYTLVFGPGVAVTSGLFGEPLLWAALMTLAIGTMGILGSRSLGRLAAFAAIGSMGTLLTAVSLFTETATTAALYYMIHSTLAGAALFLVTDLVRAAKGQGADTLIPGPRFARQGLIAVLFFATAIAVAGLPPLSGFIGKLLVLDASRTAPQAAIIWAVILAGSLVAVLGLARAGSVLFWNTTKDLSPEPPATPLALVSVGLLLATLVAITLGAGPVTSYLSATSAQLYDPVAYSAASIPLVDGMSP